MATTGSIEVLYGDDAPPAHTVSLTASHTIAIARVFDAALAQRGDKFQTIPVEQVEVLVSDLLKVPLSDFILETILDRTEEQVKRQILRDGISLNLILVGATGLGKSTFIDTLFKTDVSWRSNTESSAIAIPSTIEIHTLTHVLEEKGMKLKLNVTDTPGFSDAVDNTQCWQPICEFIDFQHSAYLDAELAVERDVHIPDTRVHACLYFIEPTGHGLSMLDIEAMQQLQERVNIIPVIAKADSFTTAELVHFKARIREDMESANVRVFPQPRPFHTQEEAAVALRLADMQPFGVIGQNYVDPQTGSRIRKTRFGVIEIDNSDHCDMPQLQAMLLREQMNDLRQVTKEVHYENYRRRNLEPPLDPEIQNAEEIAHNSEISPEVSAVARDNSEPINGDNVTDDATSRSEQHSPHVQSSV
eukprot:gene3049-5829_t